jgi:hypothetical protein
VFPRPPVRPELVLPYEEESLSYDDELLLPPRPELVFPYEEESLSYEDVLLLPLRPEPVRPEPVVRPVDLRCCQPCAR